MQPRTSAFKFNGPFRGLATSPSELELGPGYARVANNILLTDGRIMPRPPLVSMGQGYVGLGGYSAFHFLEAAVESRFGVVLVKLSQADTGQLIANSVGHGQVELKAGLSPNLATWVEANGHVYVLDGTARLVKTDGTVSGTANVGIAPCLTNVRVRFVGITDLPLPNEHDGLAPGSVFQWGVTFYDKDRDVESNASFSGEHLTSSAAGGYQMEFALNYNGNLPFPGDAVTHWRIYRRNVGNQEVGFRLVHELPFDSGFTGFWDTLHDDEIELSSTALGPWAPSLNGLPPAATIGAMVNDRMFYNDPEDDDIVRVSHIGRPDHVAPLDFLSVPGYGKITGMTLLQGQMAIFKEGAIYIIAGDMVTPTNDTVATGAITSASLPEVFRTPSAVGCANTLGGNGAVSLGGMAFFNSRDGFYAFDGSHVRQMTKLVRPTWIDFANTGGASDGDQAITYAVDATHEILYMTMHGITNEPPNEPQVLAYHWGIVDEAGRGAWTTISEPIGGVLAVCTAQGKPVESGLNVDRHEACGMIALLDNGIGYHAMFLDHDRDDTRAMPSIHWRTGRLRLAGSLRFHLYHAKLIHTPNQSNLVFSYRRDGGDAVGKTLHLAGRTASPMRVSRECGDVALEIQTFSMSGGSYDPEFGILGFELDAEVSGQR